MTSRILAVALVVIAPVVLSAQSTMGATANARPEVTTSKGVTHYTEDGKPRAVDGALGVSDADDTHFERATIRVIDGLQPGDQLLFKDRRAITGTYRARTGVLILTGHATKAGYRDALRSVRFRTSHENPGAHRTISFRVSDGRATSARVTKAIEVTRNNDAPTVILTPGLRYYTEGDGAQRVDPALTIEDPDNKRLSGATVRVGTNFNAKHDQLTVGGVAGITGTYDSGTGVLTLKGGASLGAYQAALRSVRFAYSGDSPPRFKSVEFRVRDAGKPAETSKAATRLVRCFWDDDGPVVMTSEGSTSYNVAAGTPVEVDPGLTLTDVDDANIEAARVHITSGFDEGDVLSFVDQNGISGHYRPETGVLLLTGTATKSDYEAALRSVTFSTQAKTPSTPKTIGFAAYDGEAPSNEATKDVTLFNQ